MSLFTHEQVSIMAAERLGLDESAALDLQPLVPSALNALSVEIASNPQKRQWLLTDPSTTTATLTSNAADISTLVSTNGVLKDFLRYGFIYYNSITGQALIWINQTGAGRLAGPFDSIFNHCYLQGDTLYTRGPSVTALSGTLHFAVPYTPSLSQLPEQLVDDLVTTIVKLRTTRGKAEANAA